MWLGEQHVERLQLMRWTGIRHDAKGAGTTSRSNGGAIESTDNGRGTAERTTTTAAADAIYFRNNSSAGHTEHAAGAGSSENGRAVV